MIPTTRPYRLTPGDCLFELFEELCTEARTLPLHDADRRETWRANCHQLLQQVGDMAQRVAWSMELAQHLALGTGLPVAVAFGYVRRTS